MAVCWTISRIASDQIDALLPDIIAVRTSAYAQWNGEKTDEEQAQSAAQWRHKWSRRGLNRNQCGRFILKVTIL